MKQTIFIFLAVIAFFSCGTKGKSDNNEAPEVTKTETTATTIHLTKAEFLKKVVDYETNPQEWKYLGDKPCIIDFYATWCGPCRAIAPILDELAAEYSGKIYIYKIDVDKERELAGALGISSIPALFFVPMQGPPQVSQGAMPKTNFERVIKELLLAEAV